MFLFCDLGTGFEAVAGIAGLENVAAVGEPIEQGRGHLGVTEDCCPFTEAEVGRDDHARAFPEKSDSAWIPFDSEL